jgi:thiamine-monophosphate kinase
MDEFELIKKFFANFDKGEHIKLGIGDDCALLTCPSDSYLAVSTDTFLEGTHFFKDTDPKAIGYKSLAVNLSDLAAMGADPVGFTLALTLPKYDDEFLHSFCEGLFSLARSFNVPLVGGDTTRGPLSITITVLGKIPFGKEFQRRNANSGDVICVSGPLGGAALGVKARYGKIPLNDKIYQACELLDYPKPRLDLVEILRHVGCKCALDLSDGLVGDLVHILKSSNKNAIIYLDEIPTANCLSKFSFSEKLEFALTGGDDYELCFTLSADNFAKLQKLGIKNIYKIGEILDLSSSINDKNNLCSVANYVPSAGNIFYRCNGEPIELNNLSSFTHF